MQFKRIITTICMSILCILSAVLSVSAEEVNVTSIFTGKLHFETDNDYVFNITNAAPGQEWKTEFNFKNLSKHTVNMTLYRILNIDSDDILLSNMYLKLYTENNMVIYDGIYSTKEIPISNEFSIPAESEMKLIAECKIYDIAGNELQNTKSNTKWIFVGDVVHEKNQDTTVHSNEHGFGKTGPLAIGYFNNTIQSEFNLICTDENNNIILETKGHPESNTMYIKVPEISGYIPEKEYISIFTSRDGKITIQYRKINQENEGHINEQINQETQEYIVEPYDKENTNNIYLNDISSDFKDTENMTVYIINDKNSYKPQNYKTNNISQNKKNLNNSNSSLNNNIDKLNTSSNITDDKSKNTENENNVSDTHNNDKSILPQKVMETISIIGNTLLITWWIIIVIISILLLIVIIINKLRNRN